MKKEFVVYKITNKLNGMVYIGMTQNFKRRMWRHRRANDGSYLHRAINKHGWKNFEYEIIDKALFVDIIKEFEKKYIEEFNCKSPNGYNLSDGGDGNHGWVASEETRKKIGDAQRGKYQPPASEETRKKLSEAARKQWADTKIREKMMLRKKGGRPIGCSMAVSDETKKKISNAWKLKFKNGYKHSDATRKKLSDSVKKYWYLKKLNNLEGQHGRFCGNQQYG